MIVFFQTNLICIVAYFWGKLVNTGFIFLVYTETQEPPEKISKLDKKPKEKSEKKLRATKKKDEVEEDNDHEEEEAVLGKDNKKS